MCARSWDASICKILGGVYLNQSLLFTESYKWTAISCPNPRALLIFRCVYYPLDLSNDEENLERIGEKRTFLNNILRRKANWVVHILRRNCLLHDVIEGQMTEVKGVGTRRTQLLDDLRNRRRYWELKEEAEVRNRWKPQFINGA